MRGSGIVAKARGCGRMMLAAAALFLLPACIAQAATDRSSVRIPLGSPAAVEHLELPRVIGARGSHRPLVVIDAGHGGHDPGASSADGRYQEKDAALQIA